MPDKTIQAPVGNPTECNPVNQPADVLTVKWLLYNIPESEGGPTGSLRTICDPNGQGIYNPALQQIILNFQLKRRSKGVDIQNEWFVGGRVKPGSITLREMNRIVFGEATPASAPTRPDPSSYVIPVRSGAPTNWNPAPAPTAPLEADGGFWEFLKDLMGRRTNWKMSGGAGGGFGIGPVGVGGGKYTVTRPDGSEFSIVGTYINTGLSVVPAAFSMSGSETPGGSVIGVYSSLRRPPEDGDFEGGFLTLSASINFPGIGGGITLWCGGYGANLPGWSSLVALATGPVFGPTLAVFKAASVVSIFAGLQYGTPDAGVSIALGHAARPTSGPIMQSKEGQGGVYRGSL